MKTTYLSAADTAKLVRAALKKAFPGTKFSVRSENFSMGCAVRVRWTDGPLGSAVQEIAGMFQGKGFDGSIDLGYSMSLWLLPDGTATVASTPGTSGSGGSHAPQREWMPHPDAKLISTGAYVTCQRDVSDSLKARVQAWLSRRDWEFFKRYPGDDVARVAHDLAYRSTIMDGHLVVVRDGRR